MEKILIKEKTCKVRKNAHNLWFSIKKHTFIHNSVTGSGFSVAMPQKPESCLPLVCSFTFASYQSRSSSLIKIKLPFFFLTIKGEAFRFKQKLCTSHFFGASRLEIVTDCSSLVC